MDDDARRVFVGGLHRSGTTPLARALDSHPDVSGLHDTGVFEDEGQHLQDVYPKIRAYGGMGRFANAEAAHLTEASPLVTPENRQRLLAAWEPYWDLQSPYLLEKSPSNLIMGRFLQAVFPGSALIVVVRHPIVVSLALQKWNPRFFARNGRRHVSLPGLVEHWLRAHDTMRADAARLDRLLVLRYETLVEQPVDELARVQRFLGLTTPISSDTLRPGRSQAYEEEWDAYRSGSARKQRIRRTIEERFGPAIADYGYDVADLTKHSTTSVVPGAE